MMKNVLRISFLTLLSFNAAAQTDGVLIDYNPLALPRDNSALLDLRSLTQGMLIPRMTYAEQQAIPSPANSLLIFNTTSDCLEMYAGGAWQSVYCSCPVLDPLQPILGPAPVCSGATVNFSVPSVTGVADFAWVVSGVPAGSISGNGSNAISFPAPATSTFTVDVTASNACLTSSSSQSTVVNAYTNVPPTPVFNATPAGLCEGGSYNYSVVNGLGVNGTGAISYTWTITATGTASANLTANSQIAVAGSPVVYTGTGTAITLNNIVAAGNITVSVVGNNTCGSSVTPVTLLRAVDQFTASAAGLDQTVCATTATLAGNTPITGGGTWTLVSGAGTITNPTSPTSGITALGLGNNTFRWTLLNGSCADSQDDVIIERNDFTTANAGADQTVCATSATLAGNTPLTGGGTWTLVSGTGTITNPTSPTSTVTALGLGANTFRWTLLNGVCADSQDDVVITRDEFTASNAGPDQTLCATSATMAGNTPVTGGGTWTLVSGAGTITSPTSPTSTVTALGLGANTFRWTLPNGVCAVSQDDVVITRQDFTTANAGPDQTVCATSATLAGNAPLTGSGTWTLVSGSGIITTPSSPTSTVTSLGLGANTFRWTLLNGTCADSQDDVVITSHQFTASNAGADQTVCATSATLAGNTPLTGGGTWTLVSGTGTITSPTSPSSTVTGLGLGANTFRWTLLNGVCADSQDDVVITTNAFTTANAGPDQALCATTATFSGNAPTSGVGTWTLVSGSGSITSPNSPTSGITGLGVGPNTFRWTLANGACTSSQDDVVITGQNSSVTPAGIAGTSTICNGSSTTLTVSGGTAGTGAVTEWFTGSCNGTSAGTGNSINVNPTVNTTYYVRYSGTCNTTLCASQLVTVNQFTAANAGSDQSLCATTATLAGNTPTTGGGTWSLVSGAGAITTPTSPTSGITGLGVGPNTFRWTLPNGACTASQDDVVITGQNSSVTPTGIAGTSTICNGSSTTLTVSGGTAGTGAVTQWFTGSCNGTSAGTGNSINVNPTANTTYYVRYSGTCNTTLCASQLVTVNQFTASNAGPDQTLCATSATLAGNAPTTGTGTWTVVSGSGTFGNANSPTSSVSGLAVGTNTFRWTLPNGVCNSSQDDVVITRQAPSVAPTGITGTTTVCSGSSTSLTVSGGTAGTGAVATWYTGSCGGTQVGTGNTYNTPNLTATTTYWVSYVGSCNTTTCASVTVTVNTLSAAPTGVTGTTTICSGGNTNLTVTGGSLGTGAGAQWFTGSCGNVSAGTGTTINVSPTSTTTYYVRYSGTCNTTNCTSVTVTVNSLSTAPTGITGNTAICSDESTTLTLSGGSAGTGGGVQWFTGSCSGTPFATTNSVTVSPTSSTTYYVRYSGTCNTTTCASTTVNVTQIPSDPGFGSNAWTFSGYNGGDLNLSGAVFKGFHSASVLDYDSRNYWGSNDSPSFASGWNGCTIPVDNHSYRARRQGFTCGTYQINVTNHDDPVRVYVNGGQVFEHIPCCVSHTNIWTGLLNSSSTVEVRHQEFGGGSHQGLSFNLLAGNSVAPTSILGTTTIASGTSTTLTLVGGSAGAGGVATWYTGSCGGTQVGTGNSFTTPNLTASTTYYVRYVGSCNTTTCAQVTVTVTSGCTHTIRLQDTFGDGWNGASVTVTVNGSPVLTNITFNSGFSQDFTFSASTGNSIVVTTTATGSWYEECRYSVISSIGGVLVNTWNPSAQGNWSGTASCVACSSSPSSNVFYSAANTNFCTQNYSTRNVDLCAGQTLNFGCGVNNNGSGDQYFRLYRGATEVANNDDWCGLLSYISYAVPISGTYQMRFGCWSTASCNGTVYYTITP